MQLITYILSLIVQIVSELQFLAKGQVKQMKLEHIITCAMFAISLTYLSMSHAYVNTHYVSGSFVVASILFFLIYAYCMIHNTIYGVKSNTRYLNIGRLSFVLALICSGQDILGAVLPIIPAIMLMELLSTKSSIVIPRLKFEHKAIVSVVLIVIFILCQVQEWTLSVYNVIDFVLIKTT